MKDRSNLPLNYREKSNSRISFIAAIVVLVVLVFVFYQLDYNMVRKPAKDAAEAIAAQKEAEEKAANEVQINTASILAAGDNIFYSRIIESGQYNGVWNYDHIYENVKSDISAADLSLVCQETVFTSSHDAVTGYPNFATPTEVGDALVKAGFDVVACASDHANDYGRDYLNQTLNFWNTSHPDIKVLGIHENHEEAERIHTVTVNDITISFLNYTFGSYNPLSYEGTSSMISVLDKEEVSAMIENAKPYSDCIIFVAHWGNDGETVPNEYEKQWANFLMEQGVHVLIGSHPHVLQPYGRMSDNKGHEMVVFYSLGAFVSSMQSINEVLSGFARFTIERTIKEGVGHIRIIDPYIEPVVMHYVYDSNTYSPYPLSSYTDQLASIHSIRDLISESFTVENLQKHFDEIMSKNVEPSTQSDLLDQGSSSNGSSGNGGDDGYYDENYYDDYYDYDYDSEYYGDEYY